jgi:2-polyprenyl-6-methoxyphenol hydroxylase-like FAD-dependent oxidoreductase
MRTTCVEGQSAGDAGRQGEERMNKRIAIVGAGAVGCYLGGHLARVGNDVTLIDSWPEHIETIRARGLHLSGMTDEETYTVGVRSTSRLKTRRQLAISLCGMSDNSRASIERARASKAWFRSLPTWVSVSAPPGPT